jgi:radical SAM superfamily enzyme YgiQ (UPF0313 family)
MRILFIEPAKAPRTMGGEDVFIFEPLALEYVAAGVSENHEVKILDLRLENSLLQVLEDFQPDIVGITAYTVHVRAVRNLAGTIRTWNPRVLTVVGGHHATVQPDDFRCPAIDVVVLGEGVYTFKEIVACFERGRSFEKIPGIAFSADGEWVQSASRPLIDLDAFPLPDRKLTAHYRRRYYSEWMKPLASLRTSKGCPFRCNFCALWKIVNGRYFKRKPEPIVEELAGIDEDFVFFADDESLIDVARMEALARRIKEAGVRKRYFLYGRSDTIATNPRLLEMWRDVGLARVFVGLESFRDEDLDYIRKNSTTDDNEKAVKILHDLGVEVYASFIVRPDFGKDDFASLRDYCRKLGLSFASFAVLTPLPGTDLYEEVESQMITHDYDYFDFIHTLLPTKLPLKDFYEQYSELAKNAISFSKGLRFLMRFHLKEIPGTVIRARQWYQRLEAVHLDYSHGGDIEPLHTTSEDPTTHSM